MSDFATGVALLGPAGLALKLFGPTADYIGTGIAAWAEERVTNVRRILEKAESKLGPADLSIPGAVPPRVLSKVLNEGSFIEHELSQDYFGGVLASSRSKDGRDDRAAAHADLLSRLSSYQLRTHYFLYRAAQTIAAGSPGADLSSVSGRGRIGPLLARFPAVFHALDLSDEETDNVAAILNHSLVGLHREGLIGQHWYYSTDVEELARLSGNDLSFPSGGLVFEISMFGLELFCSAHGIASEPAQAFSGPTDAFVSRMTTRVPPLPAQPVLELQG